MAYWKRTSKKKKTLTRKSSKNRSSRKVGYRNLTDKAAKKLGRRRKKGFANTTDGANRKSYSRK